MTNMEVILFFFFNPLLLLAFKPLIAFVRVGKKNDVIVNLRAGMTKKKF